MILFALASIHLWQYEYLWISSILMAIAINVKMSALLYLPGYLLTIAF